ncbi:MAG: hypothetical protein AAF950_05330 [Pseudomonadota bacterium]
MGDKESVDYYLRFAEVTEQLIETLSDNITDISTQNQKLDRDMQKALWLTQTLIRRWRENTQVDINQVSARPVGRPKPPLGGAGFSAGKFQPVKENSDNSQN